jgi:type VII secretion-associated serine protease mycosin
MSRHRRTRGGWTALPVALAVGLAAAGGLVTDLALAPPAFAAGGQCTYPAKPFEGTPWSLKRLMTGRLWEKTRGEGVDVAVIDSGVDDSHPQLKEAVDAGRGKSYLKGEKPADESVTPPDYAADGTTDVAGHGTKVAGIIAARPNKKTGFVGIAPEATIIPIQHNDRIVMGDADTLARAIDYAVGQGAEVINISQDTEEPLKPGSALQQAVQRAVDAGVLVIASSGNDGLGGNVKKTYPASYASVLAVASSNRSNERAQFSQSGDFVDIAAPGVDMISTVPGGGHCAANGTSFSAPFVTGVAALLVAEHPEWAPRHVIAQLKQTAERSIPKPDRHVGWGVVDPVRALTQDEERIEKPVAREGVQAAEPPSPARLELGETTAERNERLGTYAVVGGAVLVAIVGGGSVVYRDWRRREERLRGRGTGL